MNAMAHLENLVMNKCPGHKAVRSTLTTSCFHELMLQTANLLQEALADRAF